MIDVFVVYADDGDGHRRPIGWRETADAARSLVAIAAADLERCHALLRPSRERLHAAWCARSDQSRATYKGSGGPWWPDDHPSHALHAQEERAYEQLFDIVKAGAIDPEALHVQSFLDDYITYDVWRVARNEPSAEALL